MEKFKRFTKKNIAVNITIVTVYLLWNNFIGEIRSEHYILSVIWLLAFYSHEKSRRFILGFSIFILFWIIYDSMRIIPNYEVSQVHIKEPYNIEKYLFGITSNNNIITPNDFFLINNTKFLDFLSGFFYINWMPVPIGFGIYLYLTNKDLFIRYSMAFLLVNLVGFSIYYIYPAAPPWYVQEYGFNLHIGVKGSRAGLERFDNLIGSPIFAGIYNKNANVLAAMPSLHSAYPVVVFYYSIKKKVKSLPKILFVIFMFGIWFSAVYSSHHYIIDVIAGITLAIIVLFIFEKISKTKIFNRKIKQIVNSI